MALSMGFLRRSPGQRLYEIPLQLRYDRRKELGLIGAGSVLFLLTVIGFYARQPLAPMPHAFEQISSADLALFIETGLTADSNLKQAIRVAARRGTPELAAALSRIRSHPNFRVRVEVIKALSSVPLKDLPIARDSLKAFLNDEEYLVRGFAAQALGDLGTDEGQAALEDRFQREEHPVVRMTILKALTKGA